jgi:hypothetical protein
MVGGSSRDTVVCCVVCRLWYPEMPGWKTDTSKCRTWSDLPPAAQKYISRIEEVVGVPVTWIGVGAGRYVFEYGASLYDRRRHSSCFCGTQRSHGSSFLTSFSGMQAVIADKLARRFKNKRRSVLVFCIICGAFCAGLHTIYQWRRLDGPRNGLRPSLGKPLKPP